MDELRSVDPDRYGYFIGRVRAEFLDGRDMKLLESFEYKDPNSQSWIAPIGSIINGASIPKAAWSVIGSPYSGLYRDASVIHDVHCELKLKSWEEVHRVFYYAMLASGVSAFKARIMFKAVHEFGPRWASPYIRVEEEMATVSIDEPESSLLVVSQSLIEPEMSDKDLQKIIQALNQVTDQNISLDEIQNLNF